MLAHDRGNVRHATLLTEVERLAAPNLLPGDGRDDGVGGHGRQGELAGLKSATVTGPLGAGEGGAAGTVTGAVTCVGMGTGGVVLVDGSLWI